MDLSFSCKSAYVNPGGVKSITVEVSDVSPSDLLNEIDIDTAIKHYSVKELLDEIGEDAARKHFNIEEKEE
jgi:hypothetical protein